MNIRSDFCWGRSSLGLALLLSLVWAAGCASRSPEPQDEFFEQWRQLAAESPGYSPTHERELGEITETIEDMESAAPPEPLPPLPTTPINLRLREAPLVAILRAMAQAVDQNIILNPEIGGKASVDLHDVPWDQAFRGLLASQGLAYVWEGNIIRVLTLADMEHELQLDEVRKRKDSQRLEIRQVAPLASQIVKISYADARELQETLSSMLTKGPEGEPRGAIVLDRHSNSLIIQASRDDLARIGRMIAVLDRPRPQVMIEATIVEATKEVARELGIRWSGRNLATDYGRFNFGASSRLDPDLFAPAEGVESAAGGGIEGADGNPLASTLGLMYGISDGNFLNLQLRALEKDGKVNILSTSSITTMDNQMAYTENGERVPYVTITEGDRTVSFEDAVLRLEITPNVIDNRNLRMKVAVQKDEVDFSRSVDGNPVIIKKQTETNLNVENGETVVISGLTKQRISDAVSGVPGLKDLPALGWLLKGQRKSDSLEEVLIFLTPTILPKRVGAAPAPKGP